jgi:GDPmannose 4,6-dehydratase
MVAIYRQAFRLFVCNGIMYITGHPAAVKGPSHGAAVEQPPSNWDWRKELLLGDITAERDWGDARDYVRGMWLTLQHHSRRNFCDRQNSSVEDVVEIAFGTLQLDWRAHVAGSSIFASCRTVAPSGKCRQSQTHVELGTARNVRRDNN